jgi:glycosyltransferase involved in cell wall biosynthesis
MEHGRLGPLVDVGDVDGLARAMDAVLVNPPDKDALYKSARRFRADVIARQYLEELVN